MMDEARWLSYEERREDERRQEREREEAYRDEVMAEDARRIDRYPEAIAAVRRDEFLTAEPAEREGGAG